MENKQQIRNLIAERKKILSSEEKREKSFQLFSFLEKYKPFTDAHVVLLYYSLPDEVYTHDFIKKWVKYKDIILPTVKGNELELHSYTKKENLRQGAFHIMESCSPLFTNEKIIDLTIVPGIAFDKEGNRLGRGKGYYDRLLPRLNSQNIGICFQLQLCKELPHEDFDQPMDAILTEKGFVFNGK